MRAIISIFIVFVAVAGAMAADPGIARGGACTVSNVYGDAWPEDEAIARMQSHYEVADAAIGDERAIYSRRSVFPWALETRFACGRAIGFYRGGEADAMAINDCDCFYKNMTTAR